VTTYYGDHEFITTQCAYCGIEFADALAKEEVRCPKTNIGRYEGVGV
jgi:predicted Zn-ribbon and HTH transcriptional regulator